MKKRLMWYDDEEDVLGIQISSDEYRKSIEIPNGLIIDISKRGMITGLEILRASKVFSDDAKKVIKTAKENHKIKVSH